MKVIGVRCVGLAVAALTLGGCYSFRPADRSAIRPGMGVRITISSAEALEQAEVLGGLVTEVQGTATEQTNEQALGLSFRAVGSGPTARFNSFVSVPWSSVERVESRAFSAGRTAGAAALGAAITVAVLAIADVTGLTGGEDPPVDSFYLTLLRLSR